MNCDDIVVIIETSVEVFIGSESFKTLVVVVLKFSLVFFFLNFFSVVFMSSNSVVSKLSSVIVIFDILLLSDFDSRTKTSELIAFNFITTSFRSTETLEESLTSVSLFGALVIVNSVLYKLQKYFLY